MSAPYVAARTHAPTLQANANTTNTLRLADTTQLARSYMPQSVIPPKAAVHFIVRRTYA